MSTPRIDRLALTRGAALLTLGSAKFLSQGDITLNPEKDTVPINTAAYGKIDEIVTGLKLSLNATPYGQVEFLDLLYAVATLPVGASLFGTSDMTLLIQPLDTTQRQIRCNAAAITKLCDLTFATKETLFGEMEITLIGQNDTAVDAANRFFTFETNTLTTTGFDPTLVKTGAPTLRWLSAGTFVATFGANSTAALAYNIAATDLQTALNALASITSAGGVTVTGTLQDGWLVAFDTAGVQATLFTGGTFVGMPGGTSLKVSRYVTGAAGVNEVQRLVLSPWSAFPTEAGFKVSFSMKTTEQEADGVGLYDVQFGGLEVTAEAVPLVGYEDAVTAAELQGALAVPGARLGAGAHDLYVSGNGIYLKITAAAIKKSPGVFSNEKQRVGTVSWSAARTVTGGAINPLFVISTDPIA